MILRVIDGYKHAFSGIPRRVWFLSLIALINRAGTMVLPFMSLYLVDKLKFSASQVSLVLFAYGLGSVFGSYIGGRLCRRFSTFSVILGSLLLGGISIISISFFGTFSGIITTFFLATAMSDAFRPAVMTALTQFSPEKTVSKSFALFRLSINLGMAIGPFAGGFLAGVNYSYLFWVDGLTCVLAGIVFWFLRLRFLSVELPVSEKNERTHESACHPEKDVQFIFFLVIIFGLGFAFFQLLGVYPLYLKDVFGFVEREIGMFLGFNAFLIVCFEMILIHFLQKVNPLKVFALGVFLVCLGFGLLPLGEWLDHRHLFVLGLTVIWSFGEMMSMPIANTIVAQRAPKEYRGSYMGLYASTWSIALMIAPPLGILLYNRTGSFMFWFSILFLGIVLAVATRFVFPGEKK